MPEQVKALLLEVADVVCSNLIHFVRCLEICCDILTFVLQVLLHYIDCEVRARLSTGQSLKQLHLVDSSHVMLLQPSLLVFGMQMAGVVLGVQAVLAVLAVLVLLVVGSSTWLYYFSPVGDRKDEKSSGADKRFPHVVKEDP